VRRGIAFVTACPNGFLGGAEGGQNLSGGDKIPGGEVWIKGGVGILF